MGFIDKIEQGLEKAVRGTFSKGGGEFEPVDLANRIRTDMDNKSYSISSGRTIAPNVFTINFAADDFPRVQDWGAPLAEELCDVAIRHARSQGYSLRGSVRVTFTVNETVPAGEFEVDSSQEKVAAPGLHKQQPRASRRPRTPERTGPGTANQRESLRQVAFGDTPASTPQRTTKPAAFSHPPTPASATGQNARSTGRSNPAAQSNHGVTGAPPARPRQTAPVNRDAPTEISPHVTPSTPRGGQQKTQVVLDINGQNYSIRSLPVVLGRGSNADITVEDTGVSRRHLEIMEQDGIYLAVDLGSTNGSYLDGQKLTGRRQLTNGSVLTMGRARIVFRLMVPRSER